MPKMTTTRNGFRTVDITFKGARKQSEILKELSSDEIIESDGVVPPVSYTPEQMEKFYNSKIEATTNTAEKKVYSKTIDYIKELVKTKKELVSVKSKLEDLERVEESAKDMVDSQKDIVE